MPQHTVQPHANIDQRHDWSEAEVTTLLALPFADLIYQAQVTHRGNFDPNAVQLSTLLNIKSGGCPEDCAYCPQSVRYETGVENESLMGIEDVVAAAAQARADGATRFCMGAAWRSPKERDFQHVLDMVSAVKTTGMETCVTLGMLTDQQAQRLATAGLDYYNHNIDTSREYYEKIITTRTFQDRLATLGHVQQAGLRVCCGGIVGMGETDRDRVEFLRTLANLPEHPQSVPINMLVSVEGTPLGESPPIDPLELVRTIAVARLLMPASYIRLSAGRRELSDAEQALCFLAGANSIFCGERLLTTPNPEFDSDRALFSKLGITAAPA